MLVPDDLKGLTVYEQAAARYLESIGQDPLTPVAPYKNLAPLFEQLEKQIDALEKAKVNI